MLTQIGREQLPLHRNSVSHFAGECYGAFLACKGRHATADSGQQYSSSGNLWPVLRTPPPPFPHTHTFFIYGNHKIR